MFYCLHASCSIGLAMHLRMVLYDEEEEEHRRLDEHHDEHHAPHDGGPRRLHAAELNGGAGCWPVLVLVREVSAHFVAAPLLCVGTNGGELRAKFLHAHIAAILVPVQSSRLSRA